MGDLALAVSTAVLVEAINLTLVLYHRAPELSLGPLGWSLVRANVAAGVMTAGLYWCASALTRGINISHFGSFVSLCVCVLLRQVRFSHVSAPGWAAYYFSPVVAV